MSMMESPGTPPEDDFAADEMANEDLGAPQLEAPDFASLDRRLQATFQVDRVTDYPEFPDEVRYDLAASREFADDNELSGFLYGLQQDLRDVGLAQAGAPTRVKLTDNTFDMLEEEGQRLTTVQEKGGSNDPWLASGDDFYSDVRRVSAGLLGKAPPRVFSANADKAWNREAVRRGLVTPEELESPTGLPPVRWKQANYEMMTQQLGERISGQRPGAFPLRGTEYADGSKVDGITDLFDRWLSPSGLISVATTMDFLPDFGAIGRETSDWGDKWRKWWENPTSPRDFIDALTGPIDDIVFPVLNTALLLSGVGATWQAARLGVTGVRAANAARTFTGATRMSSGLARAFGIADDTILGGLKVMQEGSILSTRMARSGNNIVRGGANLMDGWRRFHSVQTAKMAVRGGMRLGLAGNVEHLLLPNREGGIGFFGAESGTKSLADKALEWRIDPTTPQGAVAMLGEFAFQPSRLFLPGTITSKVKGGAQVAKRYGDYNYLASQNPLIEGQSRRLEYAFGKASDEVYREAAKVGQRDDFNLLRYNAWIQRHGPETQRALDELGDDRFLAAANNLSDPKAIEKFGEDIRSSKIARQAAHERAGEQTTFLFTAAALHHSTLKRMAEMEIDAGNRVAYFKIKNSIMDSITPRRAQELPGVDGRKLQQLAADSADLSDPVKAREASEELERIGAELRVYGDERLGYRWTDSPEFERLPMSGREAAREKELDEVVGGFFDPARADDSFAEFNTHLTEWDKRRQASLENLLDETPPEELVNYMDDLLVHDPHIFDRWDDFSDALHMVGSDQLDRAALKVKKLPSQVDDMEDYKLFDVVDPYSTTFGKKLSDDLRKIPVDPQTIKQSSLNFYKGADRSGLPASGGKVTVARLDTVTKQDLDQLEGLGTTLRDMRKALEDNPYPGIPGAGADLMREFDEFTALNPQKTMRDFMRVTFEQGASKKMRSYMEALKRVQAAGGDLDDPAAWVSKLEDDLLSSELVRGINGVEVRRLNPEDPFADLLEQLPKIRETTAAEVVANVKNPQAADIQAALAQKGYKLVYGQDFLGLDDVMGLKGPYAALSQASLDRKALGRFFQKIPESEKMVQRRRRLFAGLKSRTGWDDMEVEAKIQTLEEAVAAQRADLESAAVYEDVGMIRKMLDRLHQARSPRSIFDYNMTEGDIVKLMGKIEKSEAREIHAALVQARKLGFATNGLVDIENAVASRPWLRGSLAVFDGQGLAKESTQRSLWQAAFKGDARVKSGWESFYKAKLAASTGTGAALGAAFHDDRGGDWRQGALYGALGGAGVALSPKVMEQLTKHASHQVHMAGRSFNPLSIRSFTRAAMGAGTGALVNAGMGSEEGWTENPWAVGAALFGALAAPGMLRGAGAAYDYANAVKATKTGVGFRDYSRLTERALGTRDFLRFTVNPWFDVQRYSEALAMGATKDFGKMDGRDITIPLNYSPGRTRKMIAQGKLDMDNVQGALGMKLDISDPAQVERQIGAKLAELTGGKLDPDLMEATTRRFTDLGIMGFSNHKWQTSAFTHLVEQGVDAEKAADLVQDLYSYGKAGRSAAELSANFIFFPYSYMKKLGTQVGKFATDDLGRAVFMHDALKAYELLDEKYDLQEKFDAYLPVLSELRVLNPLGMGLSPGALGGINRPILDVAYGTIMSDPARDVANLFLPQALTLEGPSDADNVYDMVERAIPALTQARWLLMDTLPEQANVVTSPRHVSRTTEITRGVAELNRLREEFDRKAQEDGYSLSDIMRSREGGKADMGAKWKMKTEYRSREALIFDEYPAFAAARKEWVAKRIQRNAELSQITNRPNPQGLSGPETGVWSFHQFVDEFEQRMAEAGLEVEDEDFFEQSEYNSIRAVAVALAVEYPGFETYYNQYWQDQFGKISMEI